MSKKKLYHKLVRDRIPEIIDEAGKKYQIGQLRERDLMNFALKKLREEVQEFVENPSAEEAADIQEILDFICDRLQIKASAVEAERMAKRITRGGFDLGILLEWVEE